MRHVHMTWSRALARSIPGRFAANSLSGMLIGGAK